MRHRLLLSFAALIALTIAPAFAQTTASPQPTAAPSATQRKVAKPSPSPSASPTPGPPWSRMEWREIGPALPGGRVASVAGSATDPNLYYLGSAGGGVWRSHDGGETWDPVFEKEDVSAIGAVAIDPQKNDTVWVGTGETNPRNDVSYGDGVYKSTDGGEKWKNVGLKETRHISRILIDPKNSNHVVVGALGDVFGPSQDRGVYVTGDGGKTWRKTLFVSDQSGVSDMAMDAQDANVIYAGIWHFKRQPWTFTSGGLDDGLYKSTDGGYTWTKVTGHGLPSGMTGRIGLAVAPSDGKRVYALIESKQGILWRSEDAGATWTMVSNDTLVDQRPFYFTHIEVDPKNPDKVYGISEAISMSTDGGKKFKEIAKDVHVDYHAIWIAPNDPKRIIVGEDGGIARTVDGGDHWFFDRNIPIGEVYHVAASNENPYWVCGGWQDNNGWCGPNNSLDSSGLLNKYWVASTGGDGEWSVPDPIDPNWLWADSENGSVSIYNKVTKDFVNTQPYLQTALEQYNLSLSKIRFNWDTPIAFAPWDGHIGWLGANVIFQTTDRGIHWKIISPDLTLNLKAHQQPSGGPLVHDVSGAEYSDTILDVEGSTLRKGEIWVGTDDGLVQLTRDGGAHWKNVTPSGIPPDGRVETTAPSTTSDGTVYISVDRHYSGDFRPYVYVSRDFGAHWTAVASNLPTNQYVRAVRPDLHNGQIVYAGTENGMWLSFDGGRKWNDFRNNMPTVSVHDIRFQPQWDDLLLATHGRALYIMDDMQPIQELPAAIANGYAVFPVRTSYEYADHSDDEGTYTDYVGKNPPHGAAVFFYQRKASKTPPRIDILDANGRLIRSASGKHNVDGKKEPVVSNKVGINSWVWDFDTNGPTKWYGAAKERYQGRNHGPQVPPGNYSARMTLAGKTYTRAFAVRPDPRSLLTQAQLVQSYEFSKAWYDRFSVVDSMLNGLDTAKKQLQSIKTASLQGRVSIALAQRDRIFHTLTADFHNDEDSIQRPGALREDIESLLDTGDTILTPATQAFGDRIAANYRAAVAQYNTFITSAAPLVATIHEKAPAPVR